MVELNINGKKHSLDIDKVTPLLWVLRDTLKLTGTKYGCGIEQCGACTVHVNGRAVRSCVIQIGEVEGMDVMTIEGLSLENSHPVQQAWIQVDVPQCGYCQAGQLMSAAALLDQNPRPSENDIDTAMAGNICRCGCYSRIKGAIQEAARRRA